MTKNTSILLLQLFLFNSSFCQDQLNAQYMFALKLFDEENYFDAITEFKRLEFFDSLNQYQFLANKFIALAYKKGGKYDLALKYLAKAKQFSTDYDSTFSVKIEMIKINLLQRNISQAKNLLNEMIEDERSKKFTKEINYWNGWAYIFNDEWEKAANEFSKVDNNHELKQLCNNVYNLMYSKTTAKILSYILPGAGQFYTGNYLSGILSLGWVTLWSVLSINAFAADRIFDGVMISNFLAFRFYNGNLQNAENFVDEYNNQLSHWMLNYLQHNYFGEKP